MSERVTGDGAVTGPSHWVRAALPLVVIVALYAGVAAACGWLWYRLWAPPASGVVVAVEGEKIWVPQPYVEGYATEFSGTGWYVVVACTAGILLGFLAGALVYRRELAILVAVSVGSVVAAWVMYRVGLTFRPPDPHQLTQSSPEGTTLDATLVVHGRSPFLAFPVGSYLGLSVSLLGFTRRPAKFDDSGLPGHLPG